MRKSTLFVAALALASVIALPGAGAFARGIPPAALAADASLAPMLRQVTPGVVNISVLTRSPQEDNPLFSDPFFRRFFGLPDQPQAQQSAGSGVIVDAARGYVLTNHHVIANAIAVTITLKDRRELKARLVGSDPATDIALLRVDERDIAAVPLGDSEQLQVGDFVVAIGNPFGIGQTVTSGIVSALGRTGLNVENYEDFIQTDAAINPGNSGGALVNLRGELVGINTAIIGPAGGNVGIGFAVPINLARAVMDQLIRFGDMRRGFVGIAANGRAVQTGADLRNRMGLTPVGEEVRLAVVRDGDRREVRVPVEDVRKFQLASSEPIAELPGARFATLPQSAAIAGVYVVAVDPASPAQELGIREGDVVLGVNGHRTESTRELSRALRESSGALTIHLQRGESRLDLRLRRRTT